ncbi:MAG TPA: hypothetical protein DCZ91_07560 [Lachnospiraceae bacterium]|nr:hypothetical protein [Lachnospiraceae bacterium]
MLGIMFQKVLSKKWMFLCLLLGSVLLVATLVSFPMYQSAVFDRLLRDKFHTEFAESGVWPAALKLETESQFMSHEPILEAEEVMSGLSDTLGVEPGEDIRFYYSKQPVRLDSGRTDARTYNMSVAFLSDLAEHVTMLNGEMYSGSGINSEGSLEVVVSQKLMVERNLLAGDVLSLTAVRDGLTSFVTVTITGIFEPNENDPYWDIGTDELSNAMLMPESAFREVFMQKAEGNYNVFNCIYNYQFGYEELEASQAPHILEALKALEEKGCQGETVRRLMEEFQTEKALISATLFVLEMPVLVLLMAFLLMVSRQMYELEKNEISVIKSRGSSGSQIFRLYLYQSIFLTAAGVLLGFPLGILFVQGLGSASNFLEFGLHRNLEIKYSATVWMYLAAAVVITVVIMTFPAVQHSKVSIVNLKQNKAVRKHSWWERFFLDFICLAVGIYGYYNYSHNRTALEENVLTGQALDPLLYVSSALFIVGLGLLFLRLQPLIVKLIYTLGQRFWHPASYASFIESRRNGRKQQFIMLFLILTVSLGIFYATTARTILQNARNNIAYLDGADVIVKEKWKNNAKAVISYQHQGMDLPFYYTEPDPLKYNSLGVKSYTKVFYSDGAVEEDGSWSSAYAQVEQGGISVLLMGIHTREFGENTWIDRELLGEHYYTYLNALADEPKGLLMSRNFQTQQGCELGDKIKYGYVSTVTAVVDGNRDEVTNRYEMEGIIVGFVDYWPGYKPVSTGFDYSGEVSREENYLVVANTAALQESFGRIREPYEVWITLDENTDAGAVADWIDENDVSVTKYVNRETDLRRAVEEPLLQGTNGVLTMSFLVMILLCAVGYLIYWIMSIRSRELAFGTLRAFGMHKGELFHMLILEQIFSGALSIFAGIGIGKLASRMFVPMLQMAYAASDQVLPLHLYARREDMLRLYGAVALVMAVCLIVLILLVFKLNVTKALKLGEE